MHNNYWECIKIWFILVTILNQTFICKVLVFNDKRSQGILYCSLILMFMIQSRIIRLRVLWSSYNIRRETDMPVCVCTSSAHIVAKKYLNNVQQSISYSESTFLSIFYLLPKIIFVQNFLGKNNQSFSTHTSLLFEYSLNYVNTSVKNTFLTIRTIYNPVALVSSYRLCCLSFPSRCVLVFFHVVFWSFEYCLGLI